MAELTLINVNKKYKLSNKNYFQALYNINVEFNKGELVSIVGESGSGKSTLMNLIGGLDSDFEGTILADGEDLSKLTDRELDKYRKNKIGFVFQSFNLISHLSILDNVTLALTLSNVGEKERVEKATEILKKVGLESQLKKKPNQLSGGQKQRVAIARALINDPEIIIADEPTGALDSATSMQILEILKDIADSGKLVIMVTHSEKVASISSRVVEISDGRIVSDKTNENYQKNASVFAETDKNQAQQKEETATEDSLQNATDSKKKPKKFLFQKDKQNLSIFSAIRLSLHNMWASKVKNFLMAFGVAIGIGSLVLMMCFSSGLTDFINNTMKSYSNPEIVTVSKKNEGSIVDMLAYNPFTGEDKTELIESINTHLESKEISFRVTEENLTPGFNMMAIASDAKATYSDIYGKNLSEVLDFGPDPSDPYYDDYVNDKDKFFEDHFDSKNIYYLYTIPPYYSDSNVIDGKMSKFDPATGKGGFMFSKGITELVGTDAIDKEIRISFNFQKSKTDPPTLIKETDTICGIMDTSIMSNYLVVYIDYDYLQYIFEKYVGAGTFLPTTYYINTGSAEITNEINDYLTKTEKYNGSIEDQLAGMFEKMSDTVGTSLIVISCISLLVSAMMILVVLYMSVSERTKEIGVLKSIGARQKDIKRIFTSESFLIGILSGILGILFNLVLTGVVYLTLKYTINIVPISYRWWYFAIALGVSIFISMIAGLYPSSKAAKLDPVESLRRE